MKTTKNHLIVLLPFLFLSSLKSWSQNQNISWSGGGPTLWPTHLNSLNPEDPEGQIVIELTGVGNPTDNPRIWKIAAAPCADIVVNQDAEAAPISFACGKLSAHIANTMAGNQQLIVKGVSSMLPENSETFSMVVTVVNCGCP